MDTYCKGLKKPNSLVVKSFISQYKRFIGTGLTLASAHAFCSTSHAKYKTYDSLTLR